MAYIYRAPRNLGLSSSGGDTDVAIGPGSYLGIGKWKRDRSNGRRPQTVFTRNKNRFKKPSSPEPLPGPGKYDVKESIYAASPKATTNVFKSQTVRFSKQKPRASLGPGEYIQHSNWVDEEKTTPAGIKPSFKVRILAKSFPTIPIPGRSHGYQPTTDGRLVPREKKLEDSRSESTPNLQGTNRATCNHAASDGRTAAMRPPVTRKRRSFDVPGPGSYTIERQNESGVTPAVRLNMALASRRNLEQKTRRGRMDLEARVERHPGPGAYNVPKARQRLQNLAVEEFGTTAERFRPETSEGMPGPGEYKAATIFNTKQVKAKFEKKNNHANGLGFAMSSQRFLDDIEHSGPGVGAYDIAANFHAPDTKLKSKSAFGSSAARFRRRARRGENSINQLEGQNTILYTSFGNEGRPGNLERRQRQPMKKKAFKPVYSADHPDLDRNKDKAPDPGTYYVEKSWSVNTPAVLKSKAKRFVEFSSAKEEFPGPGAYHVESNRTHSASKGTERVFGGAQRFSEKKKQDPMPGPGAYDTEFVNGNLLKRTFNITIAEEEESAILQAVRHGLC